MKTFSKRKWEIIASVVAAAILIVTANRAFSSDAESTINPNTTQVSTEQSAQVITLESDNQDTEKKALHYVLLEWAGDKYELVKVKYKEIIESVSSEEEGVQSMEVSDTEGNFEEPTSPEN